MPAVKVSCDGCHAELKVPDKYLGKKIKCPSCSNPIQIPLATASRPKSMAVTDDDFIDEPEDDFLNNMDADGFESGPALPKPRRKKRSAKYDDDDSGRSSRSYKSGGYSIGGGGASVGTGLLLMLGAVVWFVVGLANDVIFFYPPVLFIAGMIQVGRGLFNSD